MKSVKAFVIPALIAGILTAACTKTEKSGEGKSAAPTVTIEIAGSTSITPLMELLAAEYGKSNPAVKININGTGSSDGIKAVSAGTSEIGMSSRELSPEEKGAGLDELIIALDGIAVVTQPNNAVADLTLDQIRDIYSGAMSDWAQFSSKSGKIAVVSREPGSGTRGAFEELIGLKDKLVLGATEFNSTGAIKAEISRNEDAIGYISLGSLDNSIKALTIQGVAASSDNVKNGSYRLARPFIVLSKGTLKPQSKAFLDWILSSEGQAVVGESWIPVN